MFYIIDKKTLEEKLINSAAYNSLLKQYKSDYFNIESIDVKILKLSSIADVYRIGKEFKKSKVLFAVILSQIESIKNDNIIDIINLRYATYLYSINEISESSRMFDLLILKEKSTLYHYILQHKGKLEFKKKNYRLALNYFIKAKRFRKNNIILLNSTKLAIKRTTKLL